jgi:hypothetical protein
MLRPNLSFINDKQTALFILPCVAFYLAPGPGIDLLYEAATGAKQEATVMAVDSAAGQ